MKSIVKPWAAKLGLRHQGVLMAAIRGCDSLTKENPWKELTRVYRGVVLEAHVGDPAKAVSFMKVLTVDEFEGLCNEAASDFDSLPIHYVLHFMHAAQVVGYHHPEEIEALKWRTFYIHMCRKMHLNYETQEQLDARLNATESEFRRLQSA